MNSILNTYNLEYKLSDGKVIFSHVDVSVKHGDKICLVGPNGAGKTTLLKVLHGLLAPSQGNIERTALSYYMPQLSTERGRVIALILYQMYLTKSSICRCSC